MKPKPHTIQWIAPHLSEGEVQALYEAVKRAIGEQEDADIRIDGTDVYRNSDRVNHRHQLRREQRVALATLFGMEI